MEKCRRQANERVTRLLEEILSQVFGFGLAMEWISGSLNCSNLTSQTETRSHPVVIKIRASMLASLCLGHADQGWGHGWLGVGQGSDRGMECIQASHLFLSNKAEGHKAETRHHPPITAGSVPFPGSLNKVQGLN